MISYGMLGTLFLWSCFGIPGHCEIRGCSYTCLIFSYRNVYIGTIMDYRTACLVCIPARSSIEDEENEILIYF